MSKIIRGDELQVFLNGLSNGLSYYCPLYATSHTVTLTGNTIDINTKDSGFWGASSIGNLTWELSAECLLTTEDYDMLFDAMVNRTRLMCSFAPVRNYSVNGLIAVGGDVDKWEPSAEGKQGYVSITSLTCNANTGELANYSITFTGQGALKKYDLRNAPYKIRATYAYLINPVTQEGAELFNMAANQEIAAVRVGSLDGGPLTLLDMDGSNVYPLETDPDNPFIEFTVYGGTVPEKIFKNLNGLESITISQQIGTIGASAFEGSSVESVNYSAESVTIGNNAFRDCTSLQKVNGNNDTNFLNARAIGNSAFSSCISLGDVSVGDACRSIGSSAFANCLSMSEAAMGGSIMTINDNAFTAGNEQRDITISFNQPLAPSVGTNALGNATMLTVEMLNAVDADSFTESWTITGWNQYEISDGTTYILG